jgi:hypothetical protein
MLNRKEEKAKSAKRMDGWDDRTLLQCLLRQNIHVGFRLQLVFHCVLENIQKLLI